MFARIATIVIALAVAGGASAQEKKRIEKAADLPRFTYTVDGKLDAVVKDDAKFRAFAKELRRDTESVLAQYDIADKAMLRQMLGVIVRLDYLEGRYDDALKGLARIKRARGQAGRQAAVGHVDARDDRRRAQGGQPRRRTPTAPRSTA